MTARAARHAAALAVALSAALAACGDGTGPPPPVARLAFQPDSVDLGIGGAAVVTLVNTGTAPAGPITLRPGPILLADTPVAGMLLNAAPSLLPTLEPDSSREISVAVLFTVAPEPGTYRASLEARVGDATAAALAITFTVSPPAAPNRVTVAAGPVAPRQGDVVTYVAEVRDSTGTLVVDPSLTWSVTPPDAGFITGAGRFVGYTPGPAAVVAAISNGADTLAIDIAPRGLSGSFTPVGQGPISARFTSDLWVHGDFAYTGTWGSRGGLPGNRLYVWDVSVPSAPVLVDSVAVDAGTVNDVKVRADGTLAVITHEGSADGQNGITLLDLTDPAHPSVITRFTSALESGVHNVWIDGNFVYAVADGGGAGLRVIDISNPASPTLVATFFAGSSFLHDVYVRNGLAILSHWDAGLVILDVGAGIAGGSPQNPVEVSRIQTAGGQTHNAWYWPAAGYVFVGEEDFATPGIMHVVDVRDLSRPVEVATFRVPGTTPHNFWLDETRGILYLAWYENGLRALDVTGDLLGELEKQGREIASTVYNGSGGGCGAGTGTCTWAPQLHNGNVFVSDLHSGLWIFQPGF